MDRIILQQFKYFSFLDLPETSVTDPFLRHGNVVYQNVLAGKQIKSK